MFGENGLTFLIITVLIGLGVLQGFAQDNPIVIGYERFHSGEPSFEGGRLLFNELGCVNCHDQPTGLPVRNGPVLNGILQRNQLDWVRAFLKNPNEKKPGTVMPDMLLWDREIEAVLHFLGSLESDGTPIVFKFVNAERGMALYHEFGCVACHAPNEQFSLPEGRPEQKDFTYPSVALPKLKEKYDIHSLSDFLYNVHKYRPQGRMPQFLLDKEDGGDIAAYLLNHQDGEGHNYPRIPKFSPDPALAEIGRVVVESHNCAACHEISTIKETVPQNYQLPAEFRNLEQFPRHPAYSLSKSQLLSLETYFYAKKNHPTANANLHLQALNCMACHERDGIGGPDAARQRYFTGNRDLGDCGRIPPPLTGVENKLKPSWLRSVLQGKLKVRPYIETQMPVYGPSVIGLFEMLAGNSVPSITHGLQSANVEVGRKLLGTQGGYGCITCHDWGKRKSMGISGLDLSIIPDRLHLDWLHQYLRNPSAYRDHTLMPSFWPDGAASNKEILGGDTESQISSIYAFALSGEGAPEGFPDKNTKDFEIVPTDKPVVQRAFFEGVGTHALLVGFPEGIHLAFDGKSGQPAALWKGAFFDAYRTWFSRFPEFEKPLGDEVIRWPETELDTSAKYKGYRLDEAGIPEFILTLNEAEVFERFSPQRDPRGRVGFQRRIRYTNENQLEDPRLNHPKDIIKYEEVCEDPLERTFFYQW